MTTAALIATEFLATLNRHGLDVIDPRTYPVHDATALEEVVEDLLLRGTIRPPAVTESGGARADSTTPSGDEVLEQLEPTVRLAEAVDRLAGLVDAAIGVAAAWASAPTAALEATPKPDALVECPVDHSTVPEGASCPLCSGTGRVPYWLAAPRLGHPAGADVEVEH